MRVAFCRALHIAAACAALATSSAATEAVAAFADSPLPTVATFFRNAEVADVRLSPSGA